MLTLHSGETISGAHLDELIAHARTAVAALNNFPRHYPRFLLEQAAIAGALNPEILSDAGQGGGSGQVYRPAAGHAVRGI